MTYRTLLAHLPLEIDAGAVLRAATALAERHAAHLIGLHVQPRLDLPYAYEIPAVMVREFEATNRERGETLGELFEAATRHGGFVADWRVEARTERSTEEIMVELGNTADLAVIAMTRPKSRRGSRDELAARVLAIGARPVLLVPPEADFPDIGKRVFVAWDGQRAATRALFGALPMLRSADVVRLQRINSPAHDRQHARGATEELADTLSRHDVNVDVFHADAHEKDVGRELLAFAGDWGADVIVSGCQEQGRLKEFLLGSTTRHLLEHTKVPVLMSA